MATDRVVKESIVRDLADLARRSGQLPNTRKLETIASEDIRRTDALLRERRGMATVQRRRIAAQRATRELIEEGKTLTRREVPAGNPDPQMKAPCSCGTCVKCRLRQRLWALLQADAAGAPIHPGPRSDIISEWFDCRAGRKDYRALAPVDRARLFDRRLADIADRSRAIIGLTKEWNASHG